MIRITTTIAALIAFGVPTHAATVEVPTDFGSIQAAVVASSSGDVIVVQPGTYVENVDLLGLELTLVSAGGPGVTTIDGAGGGSTLTVDQGQVATIIDGFTITGGTGTPTGSGLRGGGLYCLNSSPLIRDCVFTANTAFSGGGAWVEVGAPEFERCRFEANETENDGAGMYCLGGVLTLNECDFVENLCITLTGDGAGLGVNGNAVATVRRTRFLRNRVVSGPARAGGAMLILNGSTVTVEDSSFIGNSVSGGDKSRGGAISNQTDVVLTIRRSSFIRNSATGAATENHGGAINNRDNSHTVIEECTFARNYADEGGVARSEPGSSVEMTACSAVENGQDDLFGPFTDNGDNDLWSGLAADVDGSNEVSVNDLLILLAKWGLALFN